MTRSLRTIADTGYLLCFGAIKGGTRLMGEAFDAGVGASPTVRSELDAIATSERKPPTVRQAAEAFRGRNSGVLLPVGLCELDGERRVEIQADLASGRSTGTPAPHPNHACNDDSQSLGALPGEHAGESECISVAERISSPLLINENAGTRYAASVGVRTETTALSLRRLRDRFTANQLFQLYREMEQKVGDVGVVVPGPAWFDDARPAQLNPIGS